MAGKFSDAKLREAFKLIDADGSGTLSNAEMGRVLDCVAEKEGIKLSSADKEQICTGLLKALDANKDGKVTCDEFCAAYKALK